MSQQIIISSIPPSQSGAGPDLEVPEELTLHWVLQHVQELAQPNQPESPLKLLAKNIEYLKTTESGKRAIQIIEKGIPQSEEEGSELELTVPLVLNSGQGNQIEWSSCKRFRLSLDLNIAEYIFVLDAGMSVQYTPFYVNLFHEFVHIVHGILDYNSLCKRKEEAVLNWSNREEELTIQGLPEDPSQLCENGLRKELNLPLRVFHKGFKSFIPSFEYQFCLGLTKDLEIFKRYVHTPQFIDACKKTEGKVLEIAISLFRRQKLSLEEIQGFFLYFLQQGFRDGMFQLILELTYEDSKNHLIPLFEKTNYKNFHNILWNLYSHTFFKNNLEKNWKKALHLLFSSKHFENNKNLLLSWLFFFFKCGEKEWELATKLVESKKPCPSEIEACMEKANLSLSQQKKWVETLQNCPELQKPLMEKIKKKEVYTLFLSAFESAKAS